jgi:hypothetical protein
MSTADFISRHPLCCFCGGTSPSETIDHQPAKIVFPDKGRPKGLEFPACKRCNQQTGVDECILAFVARLTGSLRGASPDSGLVQTLETIETAHPGLLPSMHSKWVEVDGQKKPALDMNKPEVNESLCRIAAKLALATYYEETDRIVSPGTLINTMWTHNQRADSAQDVHDLLARLPSSNRLKQGRWDTSDSFFVRFLIDENKTAIQLAAVFHESVALMAQFVDGGDASDWEQLAYTFAPDPGHGIRLISQRWH